MSQQVNEIWKLPSAEQFAAVLAGLNSQADMQNFLRDVMTEKEIIEISARLEAAIMLKNGKTYLEIAERTKLSSRTIARISDWMQNGTGGYQAALQAIESHHAHIPPVRA